MHLFHSSGTTTAIGYNDDGGSEAASSFSFKSGLVAGLTPGETYYIMVTHYQTDDGAYTLWINNSGFGGGDKSGNPGASANKPNDTAGFATPLTLNTVSDNVLTNPSNSFDWFVFTVPLP